MESHMFIGFRSRGGISGCKGVDLVGVEWDKLTELRRSFEEKVRKEVESALENTCTNNHLRISCSSIGGRQSVVVKPNRFSKDSNKKPSVEIVKVDVSDFIKSTNNVTESVSEFVTESVSESLVISKELAVSDTSPLTVINEKPSCDDNVSISIEIIDGCNSELHKDEDIVNVVAVNSLHQEVKNSPTPVVTDEVDSNEVSSTITVSPPRRVLRSSSLKNITNKQATPPKQTTPTLLTKFSDNFQTLNSDSPVFATPPSTPPLNCTYIVSTVNEEEESRKHPRPPSADSKTDIPSKRVAEINGSQEPSNIVKMFNSFIPVRNSPVRAIENQEMRTQLLKAKINEKIVKEETRKKELEAKKERERLERMRKREERVRKVAENKAALLKKVIEKKKKVETKDESKGLVRSNKGDDKLKQRHLAAEQRRKEKEREKELRLQELENERKLQEELHKKRQELREEERVKKQQEKVKDIPIQNQDTFCIISPPTNTTSTTIPTTPPTTTTNSSSPTSGSSPSTAPVSTSSTVTTGISSTATGSTVTTGVSSTATGSTVTTDISSTATSNTVPALPVKQTPVSKYANIPSYDITPAHQDPLRVADNYDIGDLNELDSSDDEDCPKKAVPVWAAPSNLHKIVTEQEYHLSHNRDFDIEKVFPPEELLNSPDLDKIFRHRKKKFYKRTSSAQWSSPILKRTRAK